MIYTQPQAKVLEFDFDTSLCTSTGANKNQYLVFDEEEDIL